MNRTLIIFINLFFIFFFFVPKYTFAQATNLEESPYACPNFEFTKNLQKGDLDEDVFVLQQILNLDRRTMVAQTGVGSKGRETANFGNGTREALKRFQALFIEYIEIADGKFNTKTRTVMNNVCHGPFFTGLGGNVYDVATNTDTTAPIVGLSGPGEINLAEETNVKIFIGASEAIKTPNLVGLIIEGATAGNIRKTSSTTFSFSVTPNEDVREKITIQFEADAIEDLAGNKNENASNEWEILVVQGPIATTTDTSILDDILNSVVSTIATSTDCTAVGAVNVYDYQNPCYGKAPMTGGQGETPEKKKDDSMMQMLQGLMQGLMSALKGGQPAGGEGTAPAKCACTGEPTIFLAGKKGVTGRATMGKKPGMGSYVGETEGPHIPCGQKVVKGQCINPQFDETGMPVVASIGSKWQWGSGGQ